MGTDFFKRRHLMCHSLFLCNAKELKEFFSFDREVLVATKSIDLGGSPTSRKARREHKQNP